MNDLAIERLRIYPVKGARGCDVASLTFDELGPVGDRRWMVVDAQQTFVTQRTTPTLATLEATLADGGLRLRADGMDPLWLKGGGGQPMRVRVWDDHVDAVSVSDEADRWISDFLGGAHRLAHMPPSAVRTTNPRFAPDQRVSFADGYPLLIVTSASVAEVGRRAGRSIPLERFRPNLVVSGARAHDEDHWRRLRIGDVEVLGVKLCARCKVVTVDQRLGTLDEASEPLRTLGRYRRIEGSVYFGLNAVAEGPGPLRVGDAVDVMERRPVPAF